MNNYWFKNKKIGIGWQPGNWQGWVATAAYVVAALAVSLSENHVLFIDVDSTLRFFVPLVALTFLFLVVVWRTGEPLDFKFKKDRTKSDA